MTSFMALPKTTQSGLAARGRNWGGNLTYHAARRHYPRSVEEVQALLRGAERVKVLGTRHSFSAVADTTGDLISPEHLNRVLTLDETRRTVTIEGGVRYGELGRFLHERGFALPNLASLPHIGVAGACATGTHGSGDRLGSLATSVSALELVTADGEVVQLSREASGERWHGLVVSLGALGAVTGLTLDLEPTYRVRQDVYEGLSLAALEANFDAVTSAADSVSLFTTWQNGFHAAWLKRRVDSGVPFTPASEWFGATLAGGEHHPIPAHPAASCTPQLGAAGPWHERLPHFRLSHTPSGGEEVQSEYFVPRACAPAALNALFALGKRMAPLLYVSEIRTVAADGLWLSPTYGRDSVAFHFTWRRDEAAVREVLAEVEAALAPFDARPHWGKVFVMGAAELEALYPRLPDFRELCASFDPGGKFRNAFLNRFVFGETSG